MDNDDPSHRRRRFIPRVQPRKKLGSTAPTPDVGDGGDGGQETRQVQTLLSQHNVAFGPGGAGASSTSIRTFGAAKDGNDGKSGRVVLKDSDDDEQNLSTLRSASTEAETDVTMEDAIDPEAEPLQGVKNTECWDYENTYYPTTLPLRQPNSGDPEILNEKEFGEDAEKEYDENTINPASELGLLPAATAKGKEKVGSSTSQESTGSPEKGCSLEELPAGCMGKMLVYKSGKVKLRLGDTFYDVAPGSDSKFDQDVAVGNTVEKKCTVVGELRQRAVVIPDVDSLLNVNNRD
ncbi:hypothetical protein C1H46_015375 [Malus baccata]|uniref:DNA-directed RNA polymerase III subunit RPC4 n=1 Tax=Malus baccata TaxID=106549 RepID=A0A540MJQ4_MALBA|nr:hypothetical protein C1H46_015375 [Malus baccata]